MLTISNRTWARGTSASRTSGGGTNQVGLFVRIDSFLRLSEVGGPSSLDFDNDQRRPVPGNQVQFPRTVFRPPIRERLRCIPTSEETGAPSLPRGHPRWAALRDEDAPCAGANRSGAKEAASSPASSLTRRHSMTLPRTI